MKESERKIEAKHDTPGIKPIIKRKTSDDTLPAKDGRKHVKQWLKIEMINY